MNKLTATILPLLAASALAQSPQPAAPAANAPQRLVADPAAGFVKKVIKEGKCLRFIDLRKEGGDFGAVLTRMNQVFGTEVEIVKGVREADCAMRTAKKALNDKTVGAAIVISEEGADAPTLVVCPEDRMGVINVDRLLEGIANADSGRTFSIRLTKEMWRAAAFVLGGYSSMYPCAMKAAFSVEDLDANPVEMTCPPVSGAISDNARRLGFAKVYCVPYVVALYEGWAPAPTNDAQKAVWNQFATATNAPTAKAEVPTPTK